MKQLYGNIPRKVSNHLGKCFVLPETMKVGESYYLRCYYLKIGQSGVKKQSLI